MVNRNGSRRVRGAGGPGCRCSHDNRECECEFEEEKPVCEELDTVRLQRRRDQSRCGQVRYNAPRSHPRTWSPYSRSLVVLPFHHSWSWQSHRSQLRGHFTLFFFFSLLSFHTDGFFWFQFLGVQHIKAIITAEEVGLLSLLSFFK